MSDVFHKSCYTSRSTRYKYRSLSTNTGGHKRRDSKEESTFDIKIKELKREITSKILSEVDMMQKARECMNIKFENVDEKINSMVDLQNTVKCLRKDLQNAETTLAGIVMKIERLNMLVADNEARSLRSRRSPIAEERLLITTTHI
ncbi:uncharacterized protein LOC131848118 [Achroia grisella]|uniref:uncharacterized protein LOC131848118 n=1 Tax=Achroia grisella TaxID=688607 RepID=UPI0027D22C40|nr:uncharacterized protein LOC131848118 [Achroia grisella]